MVPNHQRPALQSSGVLGSFGAANFRASWRHGLGGQKAAEAPAVPKCHKPILRWWVLGWSQSGEGLGGHKAAKARSPLRLSTGGPKPAMAPAPVCQWPRWSKSSKALAPKAARSSVVANRPRPSPQCAWGPGSPYIVEVGHGPRLSKGSGAPGILKLWRCVPHCGRALEAPKRQARPPRLLGPPMLVPL